jgi:aminoglycoside-2''-adenylyltransferase
VSTPPAEGRIDLSPADVEALDDRWSRAWSPAEIARRLEGLDVPWYVAAGWALDLFRGRQTRRHGDLEIGIPAADFPSIRDRFGGYVFDGVGQNCLWPDASPEVLAATHQTWLRDPAGGDYLVDVFREPHEGRQTWICRHNETIRLPYEEIICHTADGIPYLTPELVLLFKAKRPRPKDQADFEGVLPELSPAQRARLAELIGRVYPEHRWLDALA